MVYNGGTCINITHILCKHWSSSSTYSIIIIINQPLAASRAIPSLLHHGSNSPPSLCMNACVLVNIMVNITDEMMAHILDNMMVNTMVNMVNHRTPAIQYHIYPHNTTTTQRITKMRPNTMPTHPSTQNNPQNTPKIHTVQHVQHLYSQTSYAYHKTPSPVQVWYPSICP